jgi:hypothetical protein
MTGADFDLELAPYIVEKPYISNQPGDKPDGNPILYMALALCIKRRYFDLSESDRLLVVDTYYDAEEAPGLLNRSRFKVGDHEGHDDYIGICHASYFTDNAIARYICASGSSHSWFFNNAGLKFPESLRAWHYIRPGTVAHYKMAASLPLNIVDKILWAIRIYFFSKSESGLQLQWLMVDLFCAQKEKPWIMFKAASRWFKKINDRPEKMGGVFSTYFGPSHLFSRWMRGRVF